MGGGAASSQKPRRAQNQRARADAGDV